MAVFLNILGRPALFNNIRLGLEQVQAVASVGSPPHKIVCQAGTDRLPGHGNVALIGGLLVEVGHRRDRAECLAGAMLACCFGATTLRKAGLPPTQVAALLAQAEGMLALPR